MQKTSKKIPLFWKIYIGIVGAVLVGFIVVWSILWSFLSFYEKSRTDYIMNDITASFEDSNESFLAEYIETNVSIFDNEADVADEVSEYIRDLAEGEWTYSKRSGEYSDDRPAYTLKRNGKKTDVVVYLKLLDKRGPFNTPKWEIEDINGLACSGTDYTITVPAGSTVTVNDKELTDDFISITQDAEVLSNVSKYIKTPKTETYTLKNVHSDIEVKAVGPVYGKLLTLVSDEDNTMEFGFESNDALVAEREEEIKKITTNYALYVTNDAKFSSISSYILQGSYAYEYLSLVSTTNIWIDGHTKPEISNMKVFNYQSYTDDCFSCEVTFDEKFTAIALQQEHNYPTHLKYIFVKRGKKWYVADIVIMKAN